MAGTKGNKNSEVWTKEKAAQLFDDALTIAKNGAISLIDIANELDVYDDVFEYLAQKFVVFRPIKNNILKQIANNVYKGAMEGKYKEASAIFKLKTNFKWNENVDDENTTQNIRIEIIKPKKPKK